MLDLVPKQAAGTAAGFTGFFGYVFGSAIAGSGVGWIADLFGWTGVFVTMVVCCLLTMAFSAMTLGHKAESAALLHTQLPLRRGAAVKWSGPNDSHLGAHTGTQNAADDSSGGSWHDA